MTRSLLIMFVATVLTLKSSDAYAHTQRHSTHKHYTSHVSVIWSWVPGHWTYVTVQKGNKIMHKRHTWVRGHWYHQTHGKHHGLKRPHPAHGHKRP